MKLSVAIAIAAALSTSVVARVPSQKLVDNDSDAQRAASQAPPQRPVFRSAIDTVRLDALVTNGGKTVAGLTADDFDVVDNGVHQHVELATTAGNVAVALVLDLSGSVADEGLQDLIPACNALVDALEPGDTAWMVTFSNQFKLEAGPVKDPDAIRRALTNVKAEGGTSLWDAMFASVSLVTGTAGRSLVLVMTDGMDTTSWLQQAPALETMKRSEVVVDAIMPRSPSPGFLPLEAATRATGGDIMNADTGAKAPQQLVRMLDEFRAGYVLTYTPAGVKRDDGWHDVKVRLKDKKGKVQTRAGYFASGGSK